MLNCSNCRVSQEDAKQLIALANNIHLCGDCIDNIHAFAIEHRVGAGAEQLKAQGNTPRDIVAFLDRYVIGQTDAKMTLAIAVSNHYKRLAHGGDDEVEIDKSNVLLLGPTGTGKTLLAASIARMLNVPFTVADATSLTQAGYVGDDVETILQRLIEAADGDISRAERGIVFIDEIDKLAKANSGASITRDVSGEGVQQALLKLIEGARVSVPVSGNRKNPGAPTNFIDTRNILFICAGAFVPVLEKLNKPKKERGAIGFMQPEASTEEINRKVTPELLFAHGMIPEFVGRLPVIATLDALDVEAMVRILAEPKNAVIRQMEKLLAMDGATLSFEDGAVRAIAEKALKLKTGARGARGILEELLKPAMFEVPGTTGAVVTVKSDLTLDINIPPVALAA